MMAAIKKFHSHYTSLKKVHSKTVASAFWSHQLKAELRERGWKEYLFVSSSLREDYMKKIDNFKNGQNLYIHIMKVTVQRNASNEISCTLLTLGLGYICCVHMIECGWLWSTDGNWKINYPVCMYPIPKVTAAFKRNLR